MPDSTAIDTALVARLSGDATLTGLLPDGVYFDIAAQGKKNFAIVSLVIAFDRGRMAVAGKRRASEELLYMVKAVTFGSSGAAAGQAAARIDALLEDAPLVIPGFTCHSIHRIERIRDTEDDDADASIRWQHRGGRYRLLVSAL